MLLPLIDPDTKRGVDYSTISHEQHCINEVNKSTTPPWKNYNKFRLFRAIVYFFLKHFLGNISPFCRATDTPVLDFWYCLHWVSKPEWTPSLCSSLSTWGDEFLRFTSSTTPADLLVASMADKPFDQSLVGLEPGILREKKPIKLTGNWYFSILTRTECNNKHKPSYVELWRSLISGDTSCVWIFPPLFMIVAKVTAFVKTHRTLSTKAVWMLPGSQASLSGLEKLRCIVE